MKVEQDDALAAKMLAQARARHEKARGDGIHLSDLVVCLRKAFYDRVLGTPKAEQAADNLTYMVGEAFHYWLQEHPEKELEWLGVFMTPDIVDENGQPVIEIKSTRYSASKGLLSHYVDQLAGYCIALKEKQGALVILYINGDYKENRHPLLIASTVTFSELELARWQGTILYRADLLRGALETGTPPPLEQHHTWACTAGSGCPYKGLICPGGKGVWGVNFAEDAAFPQEPD